MPKKAGKPPKTEDSKALDAAVLERQAMMREKTAAQMKANKKKGPKPSKGRDAPTKGAAEFRQQNKEELRKFVKRCG